MIRPIFRVSYNPKMSLAIQRSFEWVLTRNHRLFKSCSPTQTPTQMLKSGFLMFGSQEIGSSLISFKMIFQDPQSEFNFMGSKIIPEFNLISV